MSKQSVPTFRAAHLLPYLSFFEARGVHIDGILNKFKLPTRLQDQPEARLPLFPAVRLLSHLEHNQGVRDVGILISDRINLKLLSSLNQQSISSAYTLEQAFDAFLGATNIESSVVEGWIHKEGADAKLCQSHKISMDYEELRVMKIHFMLLFLAVIRVFAGPRWFPSAVGLRCRVPFGPQIGRYFPNTRFLFGQSSSWLGIQREMLGLRNSQCRPSSPASLMLTEAIPDASPLEDLVISLKRVLTTYLADGYPSIDLAAEISGTSVRTLQRHLAQAHTTYSKVVEDARFEAASDLLSNSDTKIIDVAYAVGYEDPSHFSRAFRRLAGKTPREYRTCRVA
jgi:AraC-like DNA-binding protein